MNGANPGRVILAVGSSLADLQALRYAVAQARARDVPLYAVCTWRPRWLGPGMEVPNWRAAMAAEAALTVRATFDKALGGVPAQPQVLLCVIEGSPRASLVQYADRETDLLVVGGPVRRWRWLRRGGGLGRYCAGHARCPVVVVPEPALAREVAPTVLARELRREMDHVGGDTAAY